MPTETELAKTYSLYNKLGHSTGRSLNVALLLLLLLMLFSCFVVVAVVEITKIQKR